MAEAGRTGQEGKGGTEVESPFPPFESKILLGIKKNSLVCKY